LGPGVRVPFGVSVINTVFGDGGDRAGGGAGKRGGVGAVSVHIDIVCVHVGLKVNHRCQGRAGGGCTMGIVEGG